MDFKLIGLTKYVDLITIPQIKNRVMDVAINLAIPFNRWLGMKIIAMSAVQVRVSSPPRTLRKNHVGGAHACALALLGEYPAGVLISQTYSMQDFRMIITKLEVDYHKQGRGTLIAEANAPQFWPEEKNGELWLDMQTEIKNEKGEMVAVAKTKWQLKKWDMIKSKKDN